MHSSWCLYFRCMVHMRRIHEYLMSMDIVLWKSVASSRPSVILVDGEKPSRLRILQLVSVNCESKNSIPNLQIQRALSIIAQALHSYSVDNRYPTSTILTRHQHKYSQPK
jgi:hypothetical protein